MKNIILIIFILNLFSNTIYAKNNFGTYLGVSFENDTYIHIDIPSNISEVSEKILDSLGDFHDNYKECKSIPKSDTLTQFINTNDTFYVYSYYGYSGEFKFDGYSIMENPGCGNAYYYIKLKPIKTTDKIKAINRSDTDFPFKNTFIPLFVFNKKFVETTQITKTKNFKPYNEKFLKLLESSGDAFRLDIPIYNLHIGNYKYMIYEIIFYEGSIFNLKIYFDKKPVYNYETNYFGA